MPELIIREDFRRLIPQLSEEEFDQLETNILKDGILSPIVVWQNIIIDGHHRYEIAQKWDLLFEFTEKEFEDENDVKEWMILHQFGRRNLSNYQRSVLALQLENVIKAKAKERQRLHGGTAPGRTLCQNSDKVIDKIDTKKEIAKVANVSHDTIIKVKAIQEKAPDDIRQKVESGIISIHEAYQEIKKEEKKIEAREKVLEQRIEIDIPENIKQGDCLEILEQLEDGSIDIVLTDPPYGISYVSNRSMYEGTVTRRGLMNDGKDEAFEILEKACEILTRKTAPNAHLYFFCSWSVFSSFEQIISKYFTIKTPIVWDKGNKGSGDLENDWGNQTELVIFCVKGKKLVNTRRGNVISVPRLHTSKMVHPTQKPEELIKQILEVSYYDGDLVADPFMGSGSTIKVCNEIGAKSLGIELDDEMFHTANSYING